jgi:hypothetical protein
MALPDQLPAFEASLARLTALFDSAPEAIVDVQPRPGDWSVKQIVCHLVDSASNNHQRFTRLQQTERLLFPAYDPEAWVAKEDPRELPWGTLLGLFKLYNAFILHLVRHLDSTCLGHVWSTDKGDKTLEFLVRDYYAHLDWHTAHLERRLREVQGA